MKKVERTRRARKRCACASPRTSNHAPARPSRPVVSDRMPHAGECCDAPSRRSGGRRDAFRCGRAGMRAGATEGCKAQEPTGNGCDGHAQYVTPDEPRVEIAHQLHGHARCIECGNKCANPRCVATTRSAERAPSVSTSSARGASRVPNAVSGKRLGQTGRRLRIVLPFTRIRQSSSRRRDSMNCASLPRACPSVSRDCNRQPPPVFPSRRAAR
ncbi:hypothetical protein SAMN04487926_125107 [Paraburkholderia steynii]|uniref:Uncharacterized protein n=1 Tax=Paraburkholderia steynii TaxID=1245441 RepID=A0A7Z7FKC2_9BURK|nr:hypothetical protein SAMN04487926_125107 [Paraburkholderia steynii]